MRRIAGSIVIGLVFVFVVLGINAAAENKAPSFYGVGLSYDIQDMVDAVPETGGLIQLEAGTYVITEAIVITKSNVTLQGVGWATQIVMSDSIAEEDYRAIYIYECENFTLRDLSIDGNKDGQGTYSDTPSLVRPEDVNGLLVENVEIHHSKGDGIEPLESENVRIINTYIHDCVEHEIHFNGVTNGWIVNSHLADDSNSLISMGHNGAKYVFIVGNLFEGKYAQGSYLVQVGDVDNEILNSDVVVDSNVFDINNGLGGIIVASDFERATISNNIFLTLSGGANAHHIKVMTGTSDISIEDNVCDETLDIYYEE